MKLNRTKIIVVLVLILFVSNAAYAGDVRISAISTLNALGRGIADFYDYMAQVGNSIVDDLNGLIR